jgi:DNA adenine methylase
MFTMTPIFNWAGAQFPSLSIIRSFIPHSYNRLIELFVGNGSVFMNLQPDQLVINDLDPELISVYQEIKEHPMEVIRTLVRFEA